jgi:hypothetical protein
MTPRVLALLLVAAATTALHAEPIDPCSLLTETELIELGLPTGVTPSRESQPGGVQYCKYRVQTASGHDNTVSIILSRAVPDRVLQLRALQARAIGENTLAELQARGEYYAEGVMCKVVSASQLETDQCIGSTDASIVGLALIHPNLENKVAYPSPQLKLIAALVSRVGARGG